MSSGTIPLVDMSPLLRSDSGVSSLDRTARAIFEALQEVGFFYISQHGISEALQASLVHKAREFFAESLERKMEIAMPKAGRRWRGYFPPGGELTSGRPDRKEGIYFGKELSEEHPHVRAGRPLHGANQWPAGERYVAFRRDLLLYMDELTQLAFRLMEGLALGLGLPRSYFRERFQDEPTVLFRIFHYEPHLWTEQEDEWGVREHTDYGFLTILRQDESGGLQVQARDGRWLDAPLVPGTFVINIGDMLEYWTHGIYRATPHRVRNQGKRGRISLPFFFDPSWDSSLATIERSLLRATDLKKAEKQPVERWDGLNLHALPKEMTYGDFLWKKVKKVFPDL